MSEIPDLYSCQSNIDRGGRRGEKSAKAKDRPWMLLCLYHLEDHRRMLREKGRESECRLSSHACQYLSQSLQLCTLSHGSLLASPDTIPLENTRTYFPFFPPLSPNALPLFVPCDALPLSIILLQQLGEQD